MVSLGGGASLCCSTIPVGNLITGEKASQCPDVPSRLRLLSYIQQGCEMLDLNLSPNDLINPGLILFACTHICKLCKIEKETEQDICEILNERHVKHKHVA